MLKLVLPSRDQGEGDMQGIESLFKFYLGPDHMLVDLQISWQATWRTVRTRMPPEAAKGMAKETRIFFININEDIADLRKLFGLIVPGAAFGTGLLVGPGRFLDSVTAGLRSTQYFTDYGHVWVDEWLPIERKHIQQ